MSPIHLPSNIQHRETHVGWRVVQGGLRTATLMVAAAVVMVAGFMLLNPYFLLVVIHISVLVFAAALPAALVGAGLAAYHGRLVGAVGGAIVGGLGCFTVALCLWLRTPGHPSQLIPGMVLAVFAAVGGIVGGTWERK